MFSSRPELVGDLGMVASSHWLASTAGMAVLERGGNAADAAVTAGLVLQVVEPHQNGLGGDAPIMVADPDGEVKVYCGQGPTPESASLDRYLELGLELVPGTGLLAAVVPGAFGAWMLLLEQRGTARLRDVFAPAIGYAENGYPLLAQTHQTLLNVERLFREEWTTSAATYLEDDAVPKPGSRARNPVLAATYRRILQQAEATTQDRDGQIAAARDAFYRGFVADAIGKFCATESVMDSSGSRHKGLLSSDDLAKWEPSVEDPVSMGYAGITVHKTPPWGQGPVFLQQLALLDGLDLPAAGHGSTTWVHTIVEASKLAFADREAWYGDPAVVDVPVADLLSSKYNDQRRDLLSDTASFDLRPGAPAGRVPRLPSVPVVGGTASEMGLGAPSVGPDGTTPGDTCQIAVVDRWGTMISATPSGGWLHGSPVLPELGFCLGTRAQMLWLEAGLRSSMGGGRRPRTTLSPSIATRDGRPYLAFGTPGGDMQDQWSLQFLLTYLHTDLNLQEAVDAPLFYTLHFPNSFEPRQVDLGSVIVEGRIAPDVVSALRRRGHQIDVLDDWAFGKVCVVEIDSQSGFLKAAASPRTNQCYAVGR